MIKNGALLLFFMSISFLMFAQGPPPAELENNDLRTWLKQNWYDGYHTQLGYSNARRKMYAYIHNNNDTITCVYSGFWQLNPYGNEITYPNPINTEHTVPQSFFSSNEPMQSDIFHLFPTYGNWNSERSNNRFREIPDTDTDKWMLGTNSQTGIPSSNIDAYSESGVVGGSRYFEPREEHRGDMARAVFYFYTMYPTQAGSITSVADLQTLCDYHNEDPPSAKELARNNQIYLYQGNRNPYIEMPELVEKAWGCAIGTSTESIFFPEGFITLGKNPFKEKLALQFNQTIPNGTLLQVTDLAGKVVHEQQLEGITSNRQMEINLEGKPPSMYFLTLTFEQEVYERKLLKIGF